MRSGLAQLRQALAIDPNNSWALGWAGTIAASKGEFDEAIKLALKGVASDPVNYKRHQDLALVLYNARKYPEALAAFRKVLDLHPGAQAIHLFVGQVLLAKGDPAPAVAEMNREADSSIRDRCGCRGLAYDALRRRAEADAVLTTLEKDYADLEPYEIARIHSNRGELDEAFDWFDRAYRHRDFGLLWVKVDPLLKNAQSDPRFSALIKRMGLSD